MRTSTADATGWRWYRDAKGRLRKGSRTCPFLDLPVELRMRIYYYACEGGVIALQDAKNYISITNDTKRSGYALLKTCRFIRTEASSTFFRLTTLENARLMTPPQAFTTSEEWLQHLYVFRNLRPEFLRKAFASSFRDKIEILRHNTNGILDRRVKILLPALKTLHLEHLYPLAFKWHGQLCDNGKSTVKLAAAVSIVKKEYLTWYEHATARGSTAVDLLMDKDRGFQVFVRWSCEEYYIRYNWDTEGVIDAGPGWDSRR